MGAPSTLSLAPRSARAALKLILGQLQPPRTGFKLRVAEAIVLGATRMVREQPIGWRSASRSGMAGREQRRHGSVSASRHAHEVHVRLVLVVVGVRWSMPA